MIEGTLTRGLGLAGGFTQLDWVRRQLIELAGIDPHPGTVNLRLESAQDIARWREWQSIPGAFIEPVDAAFCRARCEPVTLRARGSGRGIPAALILPELGSYPEDKIELVAALPVREHLRVGEGAGMCIERCAPMRVRAVLFDIDGTLVDSVEAYHEVARTAAHPHGIEITLEQVRLSLSAGTSFWDAAVPEDRADREALKKSLSAHASREWPRVLREHGRAFGGVKDTLLALKSSGLALGIVSGARADVLPLLREAGIEDLFDAVILGGDVSRKKPDPQGIALCLDRMGVAPGEAAYVGDTPIDVQASRAAGVLAISVLCGAGDCAALSASGPDRIVASHARLHELFGRGYQ